ncbi:MAG: hypothetical protein R3292_08735 [Alcanivorax sp.]|nr:hypothetical protein [Alcanivorax sp.]
MSDFTLIVRSPHAVVFQADIHALRVPTDTGQAGLRAGVEPLVMALEPGLAVIEHGGTEWFLATAGGLLNSDGRTCQILTPYAVQGEEAGTVLAALDAMLATPDSELLARRQLAVLEQRIIRQLRREQGVERVERQHEDG